jgi:hypothetical protein
MADGLMSMRLSDLCKGVAGAGGSIPGIEFSLPVKDADLAGKVAWEALTLQDAAELLADASERVASGQARFGACPAVLSLPAFMEANGKPGDGLTGKVFDVAGVRIEWDGETLRFKSATERAQEDGKWLSTLL